MRFAPAPEYHVFPTRERPLKPYEAVVRATRRDARRSCARSRPTSLVADILTLAPGARRRARGRAGRDAHPPRRSAHRAAARRRTRSARGCRGRRSGRAAVVRAGPGDRPRARARAPRAQRDARGGWASPPSGPRPRRDLRARWRSWRRSRSSSTRAPCAAEHARRRAAAVGAAVRATSSCRPATGRSCSWRPRPRRTRAPPAARRAGGPRRRARCACSRRGTAGR